jgi:hypothetical protein
MPVLFFHFVIIRIDGVYGHPVVRLRVFEEKDGDLSVTVLTGLRGDGDGIQS